MADLLQMLVLKFQTETEQILKITFFSYQDTAFGFRQNHAHDYDKNFIHNGLYRKS